MWTIGGHKMLSRGTDLGKFLDFYKSRHETGYGRTGHKHLQYVANAIKGRGVKTVLDWGAGSQTLANALKAHRPDWEVTCYDPAVPGIDVLPAPSFDAVVSTDVLEHIPYDEIDAALQQIIALTGKVGYHHIANYPARETMPDGTNLHVIMEDAAWWKAKFEANGAKVIEAFDSPPLERGPARYACITIIKD